MTNEKISTIRLIHYLERDLHYPNDDFVHFFTTPNGLTEESRDIVLDNSILSSDLVKQYEINFMGLPKPIKYYLIEPDQRDETHRSINRERYNKAIILYTVNNRKPMSAFTDSLEQLERGLNTQDRIDGQDAFANLETYVEIPDNKVINVEKENVDTKTTQTLTLARKPKGPKVSRPTRDIDDYASIEKKFRKVNKTISRKKAYKGREF